MSHYLTITANFRIGEVLPTIEAQYQDLWKLGSALASIGIPIDQWCPPADTPANSRLNAAFSATGPTTAALALARANRDNAAQDLRTLGVWNGEEDAGGMSFTTTYALGRIPSNLSLAGESIPAFENHGNVVQIVREIVNIWSPMAVKITPWGYSEHQIFQDRPPVGWMLYLPFEVSERQVPEAAHLIPIERRQHKDSKGTLVISTSEFFDVDNPEHIKIANAIERRLVDQDLLPTLREFVAKF